MARNELTTTVEVTGIMGAGFLPKLLQNISQHSHDTFDRVLSNGKRKQLVTRFHLDNTALLKHDPQERERVMGLIAQKPRPGSATWEDLIKSLKASDELFQKTIQEFKLPVDLAFRRGGILQSYILLNDPQWEVATIMRSERPHLQFFLSASLDVTTESFKNNEELKTVLASDPVSFCATPRQALEQQEAWLGALQKMRGPLICIERTMPGCVQFAKYVVDRMRPTLAAHGCHLEEKVSVFISHATKDQLFAQRLNDELKANGIRCWFSPQDIRGGRKLHEQIEEGIRNNDRMLLILSEASMQSEWVKTEIAFARHREIEEKRQVLFPVSLVSFAKIREWRCFDADTGKDSAREIREYFIPDFSKWKDDFASFRTALAKLVQDLSS